MTPDDALAQLSVSSPDLPREALGWCLEHWDEAAPCLLERLARYADGADRSKENESILFFAIHLMAEASEARAFAPLCRLARDNDAIETVLGDSVTETLKLVLISVFDGDDATLKGLIEDREAGDYVRSAAFDALAYLTATGRIARDTVVPWLAGLAETLRAEKPEDMVWMAWTDAIALLGLEDLTPLVKAAFDDDLIDPMWTDFDGFEKMMQLTLSDPERMALFAHERIHPFTDTIGEMSRWYCFELRNILVVNERRGRIDAAGTASFLTDLDQLPIRIDRTPGSTAIVTLARTHRLTVYDAAYLELARRHGLPLATLDNQLLAAALKDGVRPLE